MYKKDDRFKEPENINAKIWRYIDFPKFVSLLDKSSLYFCRADLLNDPFEGSLWPSRLLNKGKTNGSEVFASNIRSYYPQLKVNCWHINENESVAMWKLYSEVNAGIAIQSTFSNLCKSIGSFPHEVNIGEIKYIDYDTDYFERGGVDLLTPFLHKRKSFQHENELRAIVWDSEVECNPDEKGGIYVLVELATLINKIYVSPDSPDWVYELTKAISSKYKLDSEVTRSPLAIGPLY